MCYEKGSVLTSEGIFCLAVALLGKLRKEIERREKERKETGERGPGFLTF